MRRIAKVLAATAAVLTYSGVGEAWPKSLFTSPQRDFVVAFPSHPEIAGRGAENEDASGYRVYSAGGAHDAFEVRVDQYPKTIPVPAPDPQTYELILRAYAVQTASRLEATTPVQFDGHLGLQGRFVHATGATEIRRVLMVGHKIYQVSYTDHAAADPAGTAFLDSFKLTSGD